MHTGTVMTSLPWGHGSLSAAASCPETAAAFTAPRASLLFGKDCRTERFRGCAPSVALVLRLTNWAVDCSKPTQTPAGLSRSRRRCAQIRSPHSNARVSARTSPCSVRHPGWGLAGIKAAPAVFGMLLRTQNRISVWEGNWSLAVLASWGLAGSSTNISAPIPPFSIPRVARFLLPDSSI